MADSLKTSGRELHDGSQDGLTPLDSLDLNQVKDFSGLLEGMSRTAFSGRSLGEAQEVLYDMVTDPECLVVGTFSGAMSVAKMGLLLCHMIDRGWLDIVVSTGALMAHGLVESIGLVHYKVPSDRTDAQLYRMGYNRIYDTLEMEQNLNDVEAVIGNVLDRIDPAAAFGSEFLCQEIGRYLAETTDQPGILSNAFRRGVPVYIPAFTDSELGLDVATWMVKRTLERSPGSDLRASLAEPVLHFNPFLDLASYTRRILAASKIGIFTIGGGVPRNWAQQVGPFIEILQVRLGRELPVKRFSRGVRICPEPAHWGGLSGCTYSEGVSWGKFVPPDQGGRYAEVYCDATVAWPLLVAGVAQKIHKAQTGPLHD